MRISTCLSKKGDVVRISGKFSKEKKYLLYKIKNVIKARTVDAVTTAPLIVTGILQGSGIF